MCYHERQDGPGGHIFEKDKVSCIHVVHIFIHMAARLDCLEGTELDTEFCKLYDQHKEEDNTDSICPILRRINTEFCLTESATSAPTTTLTISTAEPEITDKQNPPTQTPHATTIKKTGFNTEEYTADTTSDEAYTESLTADCNNTMPTGGTQTFGVHIVAVLGVTTGVLFIALVVVTIALVWTCKKKRKTNPGKW